MIKIYKDKHLNMDCITLESENIEAKFLSLGMKLASFIYKDKNMELFSMPKKNEYKIPKVLGEKFEDYDTSGCDDMLPTIDSCIYNGGEFHGKNLSDHGEVWSREIEIDINEIYIQGEVDLKSLPLRFIKKVCIKDDKSLVIDYKLYNLCNKKVKYIWALHPLNVFNNNTELIIPYCESIINVKDSDILGEEGEVHSFPISSEGKMDLSKLQNYNENSFYKFYVNHPMERGFVGLNYKDEKFKLIIKYDIDKNPYLGVWINKGGFKGEYNVALEPCSAFYDSLTIAEKFNKESSLDPYEEKLWTIGIKVEEY
ncbi:hypothetical protein [Clostridium hydrogeniformans]|uniref:hypothetical protein n=1 Tax=Clostridium hydrogeniformans TaxID=349933 RepID=UPI00047F626C|nr:hypothetical protein [Clostridium hydrogeniformans]